MKVVASYVKVMFMELEFYCTNSDFVKPTYKKFSKWKNNGKPVMYNKHDNAPVHYVLIKVANDSQWMLGITAEYTRKDAPQQNQGVE